MYGGLLLLVYALGHSVLILIAGTSMGAAKRILESKKTNRAFDILRRTAGAMIVLVGGYFAYVGLGN
jgi:cytochrome c biogenesis protein CcdA